MILAPSFPSFFWSLLLFQCALSHICNDEITLFLPFIVRTSSNQSCFSLIFLVILSCHLLASPVFFFFLFIRTFRLSLLIYARCCYFNSMSSAFPLFAIILYPGFTLRKKKKCCGSSDRGLDSCCIPAPALSLKILVLNIFFHV